MASNAPELRDTLLLVRIERLNERDKELSVMRPFCAGTRSVSDCVSIVQVGSHSLTLTSWCYQSRKDRKGKQL